MNTKPFETIQDKYIMATIQIPMKITNGNYESMSDYLSIDFNICKQLPEKTNKPIYIEKYKNIISKLFTPENINLPEHHQLGVILIHPDEIIHHNRGHNISFKHRTVKNCSLKLRS